jgi:TetR/AcrR family transcriptional regulator
MQNVSNSGRHSIVTLSPPRLLRLARLEHMVSIIRADAAAVKRHFARHPCMGQLFVDAKRCIYRPNQRNGAMKPKSEAIKSDEGRQFDQPLASRGGRSAVRLDAETDSTVKLPLAEKRVSLKTGRTSQKRGDDVRERVLQASLECFGAFGFGGTSTRAVAERAGITHTLVLYHFGSKDDLWIAAMDYALSAYMASVAENLDNQDNRSAAEVLKKFIEQFVTLSAQTPQIHRIMTMEGNSDTPRLRWIIDNFLRDHFVKVREVIKRGQADGMVRDCDASRLYYYIIGGGGTLFTLSTEYRELTGRNVFSEAEILRNIAFLYETVFV